MEWKPTGEDVWICMGCDARAPTSNFDEAEDNDEAMRCPDCGELAFQVIGDFSL